MNHLEKIYQLETRKKMIEKELKDHWKKVLDEDIKKDGEYELLESTEKVRSIDPRGFRDWFGARTFNKVAKITVSAAVAEVGENKLMEANDVAHFISYKDKVKRKVVKS